MAIYSHYVKAIFQLIWIDITAITEGLCLSILKSFVGKLQFVYIYDQYKIKGDITQLNKNNTRIMVPVLFHIRSGANLPK